jgi:hypothetical protein
MVCGLIAYSPLAEMASILVEGHLKKIDKDILKHLSNLLL